MATRVLIADDSIIIQKVFERTFPPEFAFTFANNGEETLDKARKDKLDLIIADINMPLKNGFEVCEEVKKDPLLKNIPVLLLIGILDDFDEDESRRVGADGFIVKPFETNAAVSKVREVLAKGEGALPLEEAMEEKEEEVLELEDVVEEHVAAVSPPQEKKEKEFEERPPEAFEPVFEAKEEGFKEVSAPEKGLGGVPKEVMEDLTVRLATALGHELRKAVEEVIEEKVPQLLRLEIERLRKG
ncbi:MAG: response regulator [Deltaproteobacteria bacterium]|nr:response regulator [Deltaproteobacteria bacterium]